jgi:hypothetical protein
MEKDLYLAIKVQCDTQLPEIQFCHVWNNQYEKLKNPPEEGQAFYAFDFPALFVEFVSPYQINQLGNGVQIYDPLYVNIHIIGKMIDAGDGTFEQNLEIFDIKDNVRNAFQKFCPDKCCEWVRINESSDDDHNNLYHFIQQYQTNYVDSGMQEPVNGLETTPPTPLEIDAEVDPTINDLNS